MLDFTLPENGNTGQKTSVLIRKTRPARDFANFGNRDMRAISLGRETEPSTGKRFRLFRKRDRCAISLILQIVADARFNLVGKRNPWGGRDFAYLRNVSDTRFRLFWKSWALCDFTWPESGTAGWGRGQISLIWETRSVLDFANFGKRCRCAISIAL